MEIEPAVLFDAAPPPLALVSPDLVFVAVNQAYERLLGRSRRELLGRRVFETFPGDPAGEEAQAVRYSLERVLAEGQIDLMPVHRYDLESPDAPGELQERYWNITNTPLLDEDGTVIGVFIQPQEVTSFIRQQRQGAPPPTPLTEPLPHLAAVEAHLIAQTAQICRLNQRLRQAHIEERQAVEALRKAVQQQHDALSDASHDLRGPLAGLLIRLQEALDDPEADPRRVLEAALRDAERLNAIVGDLLELARLEAGVSVPTAPVDLVRLVRSELLRLSPKISVTTYLAPDVVVDGSALQLARLVANLLANAQRHARSHLQVNVDKDGDQAVLEVIDDGPGIPDEDKEAVFRRFYRRTDARRSDPGGTGLGLAIARQIAETHHGTLRATDRTDRRPGARLVLRLPLADG